MSTHTNQNVSIIKFIAACSVIFIHASPPGNIGMVLDCIARFSVPFFFAISGYYAYKADLTTLFRRLKKIIILLIVACIIYLLWDMWYVYFFTDGSIINCITELFTAKRMARALFMDWNPLSDHLWYLHAIIGVYFIMILYQILKSSINTLDNTPLYIFSACAFLFQIAFGMKVVGAKMEMPYLIYRNSLFFGLPMFSLGMLIHECGRYISESLKLTNKKVFVLVILGFGLSLLQWFGLGEVEMPLGMLLVTFITIMYIDQNAPSTSRSDAWLFRGWLDSSSKNIYILHVLIINVIEAYYDENCYFSSPEEYKMFLPFIVLALSIILSLVLVMIRNILIKIKNHNNTQYE